LFGLDVHLDFSGRHISEITEITGNVQVEFALGEVVGQFELLETAKAPLCQE
jgi:hypothetical protein